MAARDLDVAGWRVTDERVEGAEAEEAVQRLEAPGACLGGFVVELDRMRKAGGDGCGWR